MDIQVSESVSSKTYLIYVQYTCSDKTSVHSKGVLMNQADVAIIHR